MIAEPRGRLRVDDWAGVPGPIAESVRDELGVTLVGRVPDRGRGPVVGRPGHPLQAEPATAAGHRVAHRAVHRPGRHGDRQRRGARGGGAARRRAGRAAAGGDAGRAGARPRRRCSLPSRTRSRSCSACDGVGDRRGSRATGPRWSSGATARCGLRVGIAFTPEPDYVDRRVFRDRTRRAVRHLRSGERPRSREPARADGHPLGASRARSSSTARLWGAITVAMRRPAAPAGHESRLGQFTELVATAIANAESRAEVERLADEQAALRRVATLVAEGAAPGVVLGRGGRGDGASARLRRGHAEPLRAGGRGDRGRASRSGPAGTAGGDPASAIRVRT